MRNRSTGYREGSVSCIGYTTNCLQVATLLPDTRRNHQAPLVGCYYLKASIINDLRVKKGGLRSGKAQIEFTPSPQSDASMINGNDSPGSMLCVCWSAVAFRNAFALFIFIFTYVKVYMNLFSENLRVGKRSRAFHLAA